MEGEINSKVLELRMANEEIKKSDNLMRAERDKHFGIKIELQKLQMESEMSEKEKINEINRLQKLLEMKES